MAEFDNVRVFVAHVKKGYEDREIHMESMMRRQGIEFEYFLDGDMTDITPESLDTYFTGEEMHRIWPGTSCSLKHFLLYEKMIAEDIPYALVLEDDIFLKSKFRRVFAKSLKEAQKNHGPYGRPFYINYEASALRLVPRSQRRRGQVNYRADRMQCTGAYLVNNAFARSVIGFAKENKCHRVVDSWLEEIQLTHGVFDLYWSYPVLAKQGTHTGKMESSIKKRVKGSPWLVRIKRPLTMFYKEIVYFFR